MARPTVYLKVDGMEDLRKALRALPDEALNPFVMLDALAVAARPIRDAARRRAPKGKGVLRMTKTRRKGVSVMVERRRHLGDGIVVARGGPRRSKDRVNVYVVARWQHSHLVEFGTAPHRIAPKKAKVLTLGGQGFAGGAVQHPGAVAKPFLRPAWDEEAPHVIGRAAAVIALSIARVLRRRVKTMQRQLARRAS